MTEGFATAVTVSIPIFALAAGAEARAIRERLNRTDKDWERDFASFSADRELDPSGPATEVFAYFRDIPKLSRLHVAERMLAIGGAIAWLAIFVLLTIAELMSLVWLADGEPAGHSGLATFAVLAICLAMVTLIMAPTLYLAIPLLLPFDLMPSGLKRSVLPKAASEQGRGFIRQVLAELEGAIDRAGDKIETANADRADGTEAGRADSQSQ